jgi:hypothetical protein
MSYKILYITPHLSTGGCPQYLLKKLNILNETHQLYCVEYNNYGEWFIVQKNQVRQLLGDRYYVLGDNKEELFSIIDKIQPHIIHLEEMPEYFMSYEIASKIYVNDRKYNIVETSHDSSFNVENKRTFPDRFVFVSQYQKQQMASLDIPSHVIEYPILSKDRTNNRDESLLNLGLDPSLFHVVNVGLWSSRKNQGEIVEYARKMLHLPIQFHFIGNTAGNFESYWSPILANLPSNCKAWGERSDVDTFYKCMDLFLFTSRGSEHDKETSPIVIREAVSYKIPSLIYNLPVYLNMYDRYSNISYLSNDLDKNIEKIQSYLPNTISKRDYAYIVSSYPTTSAEFVTTVQCLRSLDNSHTILTTHHKDYVKFNEVANTVVYDSNNPIIKHNFYCKYWYNSELFSFDLNLKANDNDNYHGLAVWINYQNGIRKSKELGYKYSVCLNYDIVVNKSDLCVIDNIVDNLRKSSSKGYFIYEMMGEGDTLKTVFFVIDNDYFLEKFERVDTAEQYHSSVVKYSSPSNGLENYVYNVLKHDIRSLTLSTINEEKLFPNSSINGFSRVEYFSVVPNKDMTSFYIWKSSSNLVDNKSIVVNVYENQKNVLKIGYIQVMNGMVYNEIKYTPGSVYDVVLEEYNSDSDLINTQTIHFDDISKIRESGKFTLIDNANVSFLKPINIHHLDYNDVGLEDTHTLCVWNCIYRKYFKLSELELVNQLYNYANNINVIIKNVQLNVSSDQFVQTVRHAHNYMIDNNIPVIALTVGDTPYIGFEQFYTSTRRGEHVAYVINHRYLYQFKTIQSLSELYSYIKLFSTKSLVK